MKRLPLEIPHDKIAAFCRKHHIRKLSFFGSIVRDDFDNRSDVDILVEFESRDKVGYPDEAAVANRRPKPPGRKRSQKNTG